MKKFVCFGGGSAMPKAVLEKLKKYKVNIASVTSMLESGGSTGQLREDLDILPPGDISRHLVFLSDCPSWKKNLFLFRFGREKFSGGHKGHRFGTVFIAGLEYSLKDFEKALKFIHNFLEIKKHKAFPATITKTHACATLENGVKIKGEDEIDVPKKHDGNLKIKKIYLSPPADAYKPVLKEIKKADFLIFGPGDFYSSVAPCFLPKGMREAVCATRAKKIFICNLMTKFGETNDFSVYDFTREFENFLGCKINFMVYNNNIPDKKRIEEFKKEEKSVLDIVKVDKELDENKFTGKDLLIESGPIIHDPKKVIKVLKELCKL